MKLLSCVRLFGTPLDCSLPGSSIQWNFPGKSTRVGMGPWSNVAVLGLVAQACPTLCDSIDSSLPGSSVHGDSPGKSTGVACHAFLQEIFPTQGSNPGLQHCRWILYHLSHQGWCPYKRGRCYVNTQKHTGGRRCKDSRGEGHMKTAADIQVMHYLLQ